MPVYPCLLVPLAVRLSPIDRPVNMEYLTYATISRSAVRTKATETDTDELVQVLTGKNYLRICPHCLFSFLWTWRPLKASREDRFHSVALWEKTCWKNLQRAEDVHMSGGVSCPHSRTPPPPPLPSSHRPSTAPSLRYSPLLTVFRWLSALLIFFLLFFWLSFWSLASVPKVSSFQILLLFPSSIPFLSFTLPPVFTVLELSFFSFAFQRWKLTSCTFAAVWYRNAILNVMFAHCNCRCDASDWMGVGVWKIVLKVFVLSWAKIFSPPPFTCFQGLISTPVFQIPNNFGLPFSGFL